MKYNNKHYCTYFVPCKVHTKKKEKSPEHIYIKVLQILARITIAIRNLGLLQFLVNNPS